MKTFLILLIIALFSYNVDCKWRPEWKDKSRDVWVNPTTESDPPDHTKLIEMARYVLHNTDWASIATISTLPAITGFPFTNVKSIVDGSLANSTGVPYFYMSPLDFSARDLSQNSRCTILVSLEQTPYCERQKFDPQDPRCTRLMLSGKMKKVKPDTQEHIFAKAALFERHPDFVNYPADHGWFVAKLKIVQIAMVDWFGGAKYIPVHDYLAYNYTGFEMLNHHDRKLSMSELARSAN